MPDIEVNCGNCGNGFTVVEELAGLIATCPHCGRQISVPLPAERRANAPRLQVRHEEGITGGKKCPSCGTVMEADAVICVQCGWGAPPPGVSVPSRMLQYLLTIAGVVIMGGLALVLLQRVREGRRAEPAPSSAVAIPAASESASPATATDTATVAAGVDTQALAAATGEVASVAAVVEEPDAATRVKLEAERRAALRKQLDARSPMYNRGASVVVRRMNGQVHRGVLTDLKKDSLSLVMPGGVVVEVPFGVLDGSSRLRSDRVFRDRYIDELVKRQLQAETRP
jgi:hypothetical protein